MYVTPTQFRAYIDKSRKVSTPTAVTLIINGSECVVLFQGEIFRRDFKLTVKNYVIRYNGHYVYVEHIFEQYGIGWDEQINTLVDFICHVYEVVKSFVYFDIYTIDPNQFHKSKQQYYDNGYLHYPLGRLEIDKRECEILTNNIKQNSNKKNVNQFGFIKFHTQPVLFKYSVNSVDNVCDAMAVLESTDLSVTTHSDMYVTDKSGNIVSWYLVVLLSTDRGGDPDHEQEYDPITPDPAYDGIYGPDLRLLTTYLPSDTTDYIVFKIPLNKYDDRRHRSVIEYMSVSENTFERLLKTMHNVQIHPRTKRFDIRLT